MNQDPKFTAQDFVAFLPIALILLDTKHDMFYKAKELL